MPDGAVGSLRISRRAEDRLVGPLYVLTFDVGGADHLASREYRCRGDLALLRILEAIVPAPDARQQALEQVRQVGQAVIEGVVLRGAEVKKGPAEVEPRLKRDPVDAVARLLRANRARFCHTCLAFTLNVEVEDVRKAADLLRFTGDVEIGTARCSVCQRHTVSIEARIRLASLG